MNGFLARVWSPILGCLCILIPMGVYAQEYDYSVAGYLPVSQCSSVDVSPDGSRIYARHVYQAWDDGYLIFDTSTLSQVGEMCHFGDVSWSGRVAADGQSLWTTRYYSGLVSQNGLSDCSTLHELRIGSWPDALMFDDARRFLFVGENDPGTGAIGSVQVVDTTLRTIVAGIHLNGEPGRFAKARGDRYIYVLTRNPGTERLYKIDGVSHTIVGSLDLPGVNDAGFSVATDGSRVYIPNRDRRLIHVVDASSMTEQATWQVAASGSTFWGFHVAPHGNHGLLLTGSGVLKIISLNSGLVVEEVPLSDSQQMNFPPAWSNDGRTAFLPMHKSSDSVAVIRITESGGIRLAADGTCPGGGPIEISWCGATPNGQVALIFARCEGDQIVPPRYPCQGTQLGLCANQIQVAWTGRSDGTGCRTLRSTAGSGACGSHLQLLDLTTCTTSNTAPIE